VRALYRLCLGPCTASVYEALLAEERQAAPQKGGVRVFLEGQCLAVQVKARDLTGLRALSNSFLLLAHAAYRALVDSGACRP